MKLSQTVTMDVKKLHVRDAEKQTSRKVDEMREKDAGYTNCIVFYKIGESVECTHPVRVVE